MKKCVHWIHQRGQWLDIYYYIRVITTYLQTEGMVDTDNIYSHHVKKAKEEFTGTRMIFPLSSPIAPT